MEKDKNKMENKKLTELLEHLEYELVQGTLDREIPAVVYDSRKVVPGCLFLCIGGANFDGHDFAAQVAEQGAGVLVVQKDVELPENVDVTVVIVADTRYAMAFISAAWFGHPAEKLKVIGITGTKGKTTTTYLVKSILENAGYKVGLVGTIEVIIGDVVHGSLNVFAGGHNFFDRGIIYGDHADWQSQVYTEGKIVPISEIKSNYNGMLNPANPEVQEYELAILREFAEKYPDVDGIVFDRVRFDNITSDFSPLSKELFEAYAGTKVADYPDDILRWTQDADGKWDWSQGPLFRKWIEWRASVIKDFVTEAHRQLKEINPRLLIGDYTGAWYPTYYYVGVNWASEQFDPARYFDWATPEYRNTGYADLLDIYMTGLYYTLVTKAEVDKANGVVGQRTEAGMSDEQNYWYCIEGGAEWAKKITCGVVPVTGSIYVEQYEGDAAQFTRAVAQALRDTDGLMIFDIVHIINRGWWSELAAGIAEGSN